MPDSPQVKVGRVRAFERDDPRLPPKASGPWYCDARIPYEMVRDAMIEAGYQPDDPRGGGPYLCSRPPHDEDEVHCTHGHSYASMWGGE